MLNGTSIMITGGTGSFGQACVRRIIKKFPEVSRIVVFSRDELKQYEFSISNDLNGHSKIRFFIGDVRDISRLRRSLEKIDIVIHAAALKQVAAAEYNPFECIKTNVLGAQNLIEAVLDSSVSKVVALSTDKAVAPINLYGASKLASDKLFIAANSIKGERDLKFSVVRYGNVMGSRGSVLPYFIKQKKQGALPITDKRMTRFNISLAEGVDMVLWALENMKGGEIFVPKLPSYNIMDLANAICPECEKTFVGIRPGEKIHEELITSSDINRTVDLGAYYAILPSFYDSAKIEEYMKATNSMIAHLQSSYASNTNADVLTEEQLKKLVENYTK